MVTVFTVGNTWVCWLKKQRYLMLTITVVIFWQQYCVYLGNSKIYCLILIGDHPKLQEKQDNTRFLVLDIKSRLDFPKGCLKKRLTQPRNMYYFIKRLILFSVCCSCEVKWTDIQQLLPSIHRLNLINHLCVQMCKRMLLSLRAPVSL